MRPGARPARYARRTMIRPLAALAGLLVALHAAPAGAQRRIAVPPEVEKLYEDKPVIELVTMGVGSLIWERHGHIALCVREADPRDDRCYNYGIGDFGEPLAMTWGFFRGTRSFWVGKQPYEPMLSFYRHADRTIWIQPLPLTPEQKTKVIARLEHDILDENRYYAYDHFWDNCTTRVRDVIDEAVGGKLAAMAGPIDDRTFRDLARAGFYGMRVPLLITDIAMGRVTDRKPTYFERMFLPEYLREAVAQLWGIQPFTLYERRGPPAPSDAPSGRVLFALVIVLLTAPSWLFRRRGRPPGRLARAGLAISILPYVLLGAALTLLAILSPLPYIRWNESCLVLLPLDVLVLLLPAQRARRYARVRLAMLAAIAVLMVVGVLEQPLLALLLWPAIPLAVVAFWPERSALGHAGASDAGAPAGSTGRPPRRSRRARR
jgi:hypothetical protein